MSKLPSIRLCPPTQVAALLVPIIAQQERTTRASAAGSRPGSGRRGGRQKQQQKDRRSGEGVVAVAGRRLCRYNGVPLRAGLTTMSVNMWRDDSGSRAARDGRRWPTKHDNQPSERGIAWGWPGKWHNPTTTRSRR